MTEPAVSPSATTQEAWRILLVDDEPTQRLIMARLLKRAGYSVEVAGNGKEALAKIAAGDFQLHLRAQVAATPFPGVPGGLAVTASFCLAGWQNNVPKGSTFDALVARCDEGVYASKAAGRNCITARPMD